MSATSAQIREGIAQALRVIPGLQATPYMLANSTPPTAHVMRGEIQYDQAMAGGLHRWVMRVQAFVALTSDMGAQMLLERFLSADGDYSVKAAIEADPTLGGVIQDLHVLSANGEQFYVRDSASQVLGSEWQVEVWI